MEVVIIPVYLQPIFKYIDKQVGYLSSLPLRPTLLEFLFLVLYIIYQHFPEVSLRFYRILH